MTLQRLSSPSVAKLAARTVLGLALLVLCAGCYGAGGELGLIIDDPDPCCSTPTPPPPILVPAVVDLFGIDSLDGFVELSGAVHLGEGLQTTDGGSVAFESFDLSPVPLGARVRWAQLVLTNAWWSACCGSIELDVSTVPYGDRLDSSAPLVPGLGTRSFALGPGASGASVTLDVTNLVAAEQNAGSALFQIRLDSLGGDLGFEDGGGNLGLGLGLAPVLTVSYD